MYNLKAHGFTATSTPIKLSPRTVCGIFTGVVPFWDDPNIQADNPGVKLPHVAITPIMRDDPAGTNYVMEEYCIALEPAEYATWAQYVSQHAGDRLSRLADLELADPQAGRGGHRIEGAANVVAGANNDGYITTVETGYAAQRNFPVAAVQNRRRPVRAAHRPECHDGLELHDAAARRHARPRLQPSVGECVQPLYVQLPARAGAGHRPEQGQGARAVHGVLPDDRAAGSRPAEVRVDRPVAPFSTGSFE